MYVKCLLCIISAGLLFVACMQCNKKSDIVFTYFITEDSGSGWHIIRLNAEHRNDPKKNLTIGITPEGGNNMFSFKAGGNELIEAPVEIGEIFKQRNGIPILFPTPNRVRDGVFVFLGDTVRMLIPGEEKPRLIHGLVCNDTAWNYSEPEIRSDRVIYKGWYIFDESNPRFQAYPYRCTLRVEYALLKDRVRISYEVGNQDKRPLGFGFGLHPFWKVIGTKEETEIQTAIPYHMEATEALLPTGRIEPVEGTKWNLMKPKPVSELRLDDVYFGATPETAVQVIYNSIGLCIQQQATADFTHVVVYTPDRDYFCVENQTCSTDAHNLYSKGFIKESHLQIVEEGEKKGGFVDYIISWNE